MLLIFLPSCTALYPLSLLSQILTTCYLEFLLCDAQTLTFSTSLNIFFFSCLNSNRAIPSHPSSIAALCSKAAYSHTPHIKQGGDIMMVWLWLHSASANQYSLSVIKRVMTSTIWLYHFSSLSPTNLLNTFLHTLITLALDSQFHHLNSCYHHG